MFQSKRLRSDSGFLTQQALFQKVFDLSRSRYERFTFSELQIIRLLSTTNFLHITGYKKITVASSNGRDAFNLAIPTYGFGASVMSVRKKRRELKLPADPIVDIFDHERNTLFRWLNKQAEDDL